MRIVMLGIAAFSFLAWFMKLITPWGSGDYFTAGVVALAAFAFLREEPA